MGCDAIEADNIDCYDEGACFGKMTDITKAAVIQLQIAYNLWQLNVSHTHGLALSIKNAPELLRFSPLLNATYDFAVNEQCFQFDECDLYTDTMIVQNKAVLNVEYTLKNVCANAKSFELSTIRCAGNDNVGLCNGGKLANWVYCPWPAPVLPLPAIEYTTSI